MKKTPEEPAALGPGPKSQPAIAGDPPATPRADDREIVLYRCPTRTDYLCPCGAVARRLRKLGIEFRTERVPYRRAERPEIDELSSQDRVPLLVDGDEVVHDSKRIAQYVEWAYGDRPGETGGHAQAGEASAP